MDQEKSFTRQSRSQAAAESPALLPPVDVLEDESGITLYADLPGVPKEKLQVRTEGDTLIIEGEIGLEMPQGIEASHVEVSLPRYRRVFSLSKELDTERLAAEFKQGVLKLHIQRAEHAKPRRIEVRAA